MSQDAALAGMRDEVDTETDPLAKTTAELPRPLGRKGKRHRREQVRVLDLEVGDICSVQVVIEGDERDWVKRTVIGRDTEAGTVTFKCPEGWEEGREFTVTPDPDDTILRIWRPEDAPIEMVGRILGKAVHPGALDRLFEIWPTAYVQVQHDPPGTRNRGTRVTIYRFDPSAEGVPPEQVMGAVTTWHRDQFARATGRRLAFERALKALIRGEAG